MVTSALALVGSANKADFMLNVLRNVVAHWFVVMLAHFLVPPSVHHVWNHVTTTVSIVNVLKNAFNHVPHAWKSVNGSVLISNVPSHVVSFAIVIHVIDHV